MYKKLVTKQPNIYLHYETILIINWTNQTSIPPSIPGFKLLL